MIYDKQMRRVGVSVTDCSFANCIFSLSIWGYSYYVV